MDNQFVQDVTMLLEGDAPLSFKMNGSPPYKGGKLALIREIEISMYGGLTNSKKREFIKRAMELV